MNTDRVHLSTPQVSVIMPAHNTAAYVGEAVRSALSQTFADLEVIAIDDGSTDETGEILRHLASEDGRVRIVTNPQATGVPAARNKGIRAARGAFMALLDSDDFWLPEFLATQMAAFDRCPGASLVSGNARELGGPLDGRPYRAGSGEPSAVSLLAMIERENTMCIMTVFRREVFDALNGFDEALRRNEDYDFWLRAAIAGFGLVRTYEPYGIYRRRPDSMSAEEEKMLAGIVKVLTKIRPLCANRPTEQDAIDRQIARFERRRLLVEAASALRSRDFRAGADRFQSLYEREGGVALALVAAASRRAPHSLLWLDGLRRAVNRWTGRAALAATPRGVAGEHVRG
jgi:glycosyltransferase involved in cell wall biosynthesis